MSFFSISHSDDRYGVLIDIGSGSVLAAIVHSNNKNKHPNIIWAHREHAPLRNIDSLEQSAKAVMTALINATMLLDVEGRKALFDYNKTAVLTDLQCAISAPWSYTVTKTINYTQEEPFEVSEGLVRELLTTINEKIDSELKQNETLQDLGLTVITRSTLEILSNGYRVTEPEDQEARQVTISRANAVTQKYLVDALSEVHDKLFPATRERKVSFILLFYAVSKAILAKSYDLCLIDITYEATEIGIVRDGILTYSTHTPYGSFSLAREIAAVTNVPLHEAFGYLHTDKPYSFMVSLSKQQRDEIEKVFDAYTEKVSLLFKETGDDLSIPKQMFLHSDLKSETLFVDLIEKATKRAVKIEPYITPVSSEIIKQSYQPEENGDKPTLPTDTALLLSAQFFHTQPSREHFEYL
jgi:cell division ATPase FtsA